jgi:hypothetical protein
MGIGPPQFKRGLAGFGGGISQVYGVGLPSGHFQRSGPLFSSVFNKIHHLLDKLGNSVHHNHLQVVAGKKRRRLH